MKKIILILISSFALLSIKAQTSSRLNVKAGIMFAPMANVDLKNPKQGFAVTLPLFAVVSFNKGKITVIPSYCFSLNSVNLFITKDVTPKVNPYLVTMHGVVNKWTYTGMGVSTPVAGGLANVFVELGSNWKQFTPEFYIGAFIPLKFKIR